jgi:hypothetical protein
MDLVKQYRWLSSFALATLEASLLRSFSDQWMHHDTVSRLSTANAIISYAAILTIRCVKVMPFEVFGGMMLVAAFVSLFLKTYWNRLNQRRDLGIYDVDITELTEEEMNDLGDRHPSFRYVL